MSKWNTDTALNFLLQGGAKLGKNEKTGAPFIELPRTLGLKGCAAVDYLRKVHRVKLYRHRLVNLNEIRALLGEHAA